MHLVLHFVGAVWWLFVGLMGTLALALIAVNLHLLRHDRDRD
ncbi:MAG TPA: hypothetical protein VGK74_11620 [Symbiobacteriaceae bacterium]